DGKRRIDFTRGASHVPAVKTAQQPDVGDQRRIFRPKCLQQRDRFFPGAGDCRLEAAVTYRFLQEKLDVRVVLDDQDHGQMMVQANPLMRLAKCWRPDAPRKSFRPEITQQLVYVISPNS